MSLPGRMTSRVGSVVLLGLCVGLAAGRGSAPSVPEIRVERDGRLVWVADGRGNRVPDFSHCGYAGGNVPIPIVPVACVVRPGPGDDTERIQAALDLVAGREPDAHGWRGAVLLLRGRYEVGGRLEIRASGVVLRGQGMGADGTVLVATGIDRRPLIRVTGQNDRTIRTNSAWAVVDAYVPVGATGCRVRSTDGLSAGRRVLIVRPSTQAWIQRLGMDELGGGVGARWKPGSRDLVWERTLTGVEGDRVTWDVPITTALEAELGGGWIAGFDWPGRIRRVGIENLCLESAHDPDRPLDEDHSWHGVTMENVEDAWIRRVTFRHFAGGAVAVYETARCVTVEDCLALAPVSEPGGHRRHTFFTAGQQTLFLRCYAEDGCHDFIVGHCAAGPNAFVLCEAARALGDSGPWESWASGVLYDNVTVDGAGLGLGFWPGNHRRVGWAAACSVLWNCSASVIRCWNPPGAWNASYGSWGAFEGDGIWRQSNEFVRPVSLWAAQLTGRGVAEADLRLRFPPKSREEVTNPGPERARELTEASRRPALSLRDWIERLDREAPLPCDSGDAPEWVPADRQPPGESPRPPRRVCVTNGWVVVGNRLLIGGILETAWWRGSRLPGEAAEGGPALTRFMPGRIGRGWTDDLEEVARQMVETGRPVFEHHHGLWYDRRRDDHEMVRRPDGEVLAPFFEQPFARSGRGRAWDGLSRYDLTRYNPWYWGRLRSFARLCDERGLVLLHQHYFQHNILEAGAHWADCPWRPANNVNDTGFPEPPPYAGDKRIFMAEQFYDVGHPVRVPLHRAYIRQCLEALRGAENVWHSLGAEFTGPESFMRFWLETVRAWMDETGSDPQVVLSAPRDVQDAVLQDEQMRRLVDVVDFRYWWRTARGEFAPPGGAHLAPRQFERRWAGGRPTDEDLAGMVSEYRARYPRLAWICAFDSAGWAWLCAGGSLPRLPRSTDPELLRAVPRMQPSAARSTDGVWCLEEGEQQRLIYARAGARFALNETERSWELRELDSNTGQVRRRRRLGASTGLLTGPGVWWLVNPSGSVSDTDR